MNRISTALVLAPFFAVLGPAVCAQIFLGFTKRFLWISARRLRYVRVYVLYTYVGACGSLVASSLASVVRFQLCNHVYPEPRPQTFTV